MSDESRLADAVRHAIAVRQPQPGLRQVGAVEVEPLEGEQAYIDGRWFDSQQYNWRDMRITVEFCN